MDKRRSTTSIPDMWELETDLDTLKASPEDACQKSLVSLLLLETLLCKESTFPARVVTETFQEKFYEENDFASVALFAGSGLQRNVGYLNRTVEEAMEKRRAKGKLEGLNNLPSFASKLKASAVQTVLEARYDNSLVDRRSSLPNFLAFDQIRALQYFESLKAKLLAPSSGGIPELSVGGRAESLKRRRPMEAHPAPAEFDRSEACTSPASSDFITAKSCLSAETSNPGRPKYDPAHSIVDAINGRTQKVARDDAGHYSKARRLGTGGSGNANFKSPLARKSDLTDDETVLNQQAHVYNTAATRDKFRADRKGSAKQVDERLANIDPKMVEMISNEIMETDLGLGWDDIAGLSHAKATIKESVIWPMQRPDIFTGLRGPPKGILLYGPPGTGKTLIGKCIASSSGATFFSISSSSLTSKYVGDGEKMVRALFAVARVHQPSVIFIDEIDSLLTQRSDGEFDATRRIKTEFLVQFDGCATSNDDRILLIGATNRPNELDEAARRRFRKKLYIPLPDLESRKAIVVNLLKKQSNFLTSDQLERLCQLTEGYSGSDMDNLCREAALGPIRSVGDICNIAPEDVRPISFGDFEEALLQVRASVSEKDLKWYLEFDKEHGSVSRRGQP